MPHLPLDMTNTGNRYSQHADVAEVTRSLHRHLMRRQHIREGIAFAAVLIIVFVAALYIV